jgi:hypothetical protein
LVARVERVRGAMVLGGGVAAAARGGASLLGRKARVVDLYRRTLRQVPRVIAVFDLDLQEKDLRRLVRGLFRKHDLVSDPRLVDQLIVRGEADLEESVEVWKQKAHLLRMLGLDEDAPVLGPKSVQGESPFLKKFYAGH